MKKPYIIYAPRYSRSAGCRVLYKLASILEEKGFEAYVFAPPSGEYKKCKYISHKEITKDLRKNAIVVYPEIVSGNPLQFQNVVRYVLYFPGKNGGTKTYHKSELIYSYQKEYYQTDNILQISTLDKTLFYKDSTPKTTDSYFVYKNGKWKDIPEFSDMIEINMSYPATRKELADLLRRTKNFYSYDANTLLLVEAAACGCNVYIVTANGFESYTGYEAFLKCENNVDIQINSFIIKTQKLNNDCQIESIKASQRIKYLTSKIKYFLYKYFLLNKNAAEKHYYISNKYLV